MSQTPPAPAVSLSEDQQAALDRAAETLLGGGVDIASETLTRPKSMPPNARLTAITGKAGSGKTLVLAEIVRRLLAAGAIQLTGDHEPKKDAEKPRFAVLAPTNKAASVLRLRGVAATTIHRIVYTPVYEEEYEKILEWLEAPDDKPRPQSEILDDAALDRALAFFKETKSAPGALAAAGLQGSAFITGWQRREDEDGISIGLVDEASMLDAKQLEDLRQIFKVLVVFGDPAQLAPIQSETMVFNTQPGSRRADLSRVHRQAADNPIVDLAYALQDPELDFPAFERLLKERADADDRVSIETGLDCDLAARSPVLVWRNATRMRIIHAFRRAHAIGEEELRAGEPLICDGLDLPAKQRKQRILLERAGLVKGAQVLYRGESDRRGVARLWVVGAEQPRIKAASIIKIEQPGAEEPYIPTAARMGALFVHGAACTIHKAQGSQWPETQIFAPDIRVAANMGREEAGVPLWKRLAYVALTRAQERARWVVDYRIRKPKQPLDGDLFAIQDDA